MLHRNSGNTDIQEIQRKRGKGTDVKVLAEDFSVRFEEELQSGKPSTLTMDQYAAEAFFYQRGMEECMESGQPYSPFWHLMRLLKVHAKWASLDAEDAYSNLLQVLRHHKQRFGGAAEELKDNYIEFVVTWDAVRFAVGIDPLEFAFRKANPLGLGLPPCPDPRYDKFLATAIELQRICPDKNILLPVERLAKLLGTDKMLISRFRDRAVRQKVLKIVVPHRFNSSGNGRATEFRCLWQEPTPY